MDAPHHDASGEQAQDSAGKAPRVAKQKALATARLLHVCEMQNEVVTVATAVLSKEVASATKSVTIGSFGRFNADVLRLVLTLKKEDGDEFGPADFEIAGEQLASLFSVHAKWGCALREILKRVCDEVGSILASPRKSVDVPTEAFKCVQSHDFFKHVQLIQQLCKAFGTAAPQETYNQIVKAQLQAVFDACTHDKSKQGMDSSLLQFNRAKRTYGLFLAGWSPPGAYMPLVIEASRRIENRIKDFDVHPDVMEDLGEISYRLCSIIYEKIKTHQTQRDSNKVADRASVLEAVGSLMVGGVASRSRSARYSDSQYFVQRYSAGHSDDVLLKPIYDQLALYDHNFSVEAVQTICTSIMSFIEVLLESAALLTCPQLYTLDSILRLTETHQQMLCLLPYVDGHPVNETGSALVSDSEVFQLNICATCSSCVQTGRPYKRCERCDLTVCSACTPENSSGFVLTSTKLITSDKLTQLCSRTKITSIQNVSDLQTSAANMFEHLSCTDVVGETLSQHLASNEGWQTRLTKHIESKIAPLLFAVLSRVTKMPLQRLVGASVQLIWGEIDGVEVAALTTELSKTCRSVLHDRTPYLSGVENFSACLEQALGTCITRLTSSASAVGPETLHLMLTLSYIADRCEISSQLVSRLLSTIWSGADFKDAVTTTMLEAYTSSMENVSAENRALTSEVFCAFGGLYTQASAMFSPFGFPLLTDAITQGTNTAMLDSFTSLMKQVDIRHATQMTRSLAEFKKMWACIVQAWFVAKPGEIDPNHAATHEDFFMHLDNNMYSVIHSYLASCGSSLAVHVVNHTNAILDSISRHHITNNVDLVKEFNMLAGVCEFVPDKHVLSEALLEKFVQRAFRGRALVRKDDELADAFESALGFSFRSQVRVMSRECVWSAKLSSAFAASRQDSEKCQVSVLLADARQWPLQDADQLWKIPDQQDLAAILAQAAEFVKSNEHFRQFAPFSEQMENSTRVAMRVQTLHGKEYNIELDADSTILGVKHQVRGESLVVGCLFCSLCVAHHCQPWFPACTVVARVHTCAHTCGYFQRKCKINGT